MKYKTYTKTVNCEKCAVFKKRVKVGENIVKLNVVAKKYLE